MIASSRNARGARTVLLRMAQDDARAARIRELKANHPELTWPKIASHVDLSLRAVQAWGQKGGIAYEHAKKLAELFPEADVDYIMRGVTEQQSTPDLMGTLNGNRSQLDRIEAKLDGLIEALSSVEADPQKAFAQRLGEAAQQHAQHPDSKPADVPSRPPADKAS